MANIKQCDRCGETYPIRKAWSDYDAGELYSIELIKAPYCVGDWYSKKTIDLCRECLKSFQDWMDKH